MDNLTLKVGQRDDVVIDNTDRANARPGQIHQRRSAETTCANHQNLCPTQPHLAGAAHFAHHDVAGIPLQLYLRHASRWGRRLFLSNVFLGFVGAGSQLAQHLTIKPNHPDQPAKDQPHGRAAARSLTQRRAIRHRQLQAKNGDIQKPQHQPARLHRQPQNVPNAPNQSRNTKNQNHISGPLLSQNHPRHARYRPIRRPERIRHDAPGQSRLGRSYRRAQ